MPPPKKKNSIQRRADRRMRVAALYLQGRTQTEIARVVGVSQMTVSNDLAAVRKEWLASTLRDFDAMQAEELAKLQHLEAEAWREWDRSRQSGLGDPRFLTVVFRCVETRMKMFGMFDDPPPPPQKVNKVFIDLDAMSGRTAPQVEEAR